jgi:hypothetical protein
MSMKTIPSEAEVLKILAHYEAVTDSLIDPDQTLYDKDGSAASGLLSIDESLPSEAITKMTRIPPVMQAYVDELSIIAFEVMTAPTVFISAEILKRYVEIQSKLRKPSLIPPIFQLFPKKPQPVEGSSPIKYNTPNPNKSVNAIPPTLADRALQAAIVAKDFNAATAIVDTAYATRAFRRSKFLRKGLLPAVAVALGPLAAYALAAKMATFQTAVDPTAATNVAFVGILAYVGFTGTIGLVAVATSNDQMDRVTWAQGTPLRQRWSREEERAAIDKIAGAWGFRESWRRGDEEGEEWSTLRDWIGLKGMVLDQVSLMEGME